MMIQFFRQFIYCGFSGWCIECLWTGIKAILSHTDPYLYCKTSVWMFPIYGMAALILPLSRALKNRSILLRGLVYMLLIFTAEFTFGEILKFFHVCPWNYSASRFHLDGVIRLDYAPLWFLVGLFYEHFLNNMKFSFSEKPPSAII